MKKFIAICGGILAVLTVAASVVAFIAYKVKRKKYLKIRISE